MKVTAKMVLLMLLASGVISADETPTRTDSVEAKIGLLEEAYQTGRLDLAMSLAESLKDTLTQERRAKPTEASIHVESASAAPVKDLPSAWAEWAEGWSHYQTVSLTETIGIDRIDEPVHLRLAVSAAQLHDPWREIRLARIGQSNNGLTEVPSQILEHVRTKDAHHCEVVFQANVLSQSEANYLILFGNPNAERPNYTSDLQSMGDGYALAIENHHYTAQLSHQMGQLERLISKRQHGLELYAGGKGHGEPPSIDWAHDYVDKGQFQKLRIKNWAACPNFEVVRGPVCVRVRRWGFPHSPVHPLFTPSRMHVDQTYTFYARIPHFIKQGTMEAIVDMEIAAMRDDEWVLSGYSFDETLWIDREGQVHEGKVSGGQENDLWGVGFYQRTSRDAFMALWLAHEAVGFPDIQHGGAPTLQYDGHGQLWSRYPANEAHLKAGTVFKQRNAYLMTHYPVNEGSENIARLRRQLVNPLRIGSESLPGTAEATATGRLARPGEMEETGPLKRAIWEVLREVKDEQLYKIDANIVDMGYVYDVRVEDGIATVLVTMPHRGRPVYQFLVTQGGGRVEEGIQERVRRIEGVRDVVVEFTWEPTWTINRVTRKGRAALGLAQGE